jgi:putative drug exporter of the RND superfamily
VVWDGFAATVTVRRALLMGLGIVLLGIGFMVVIGADAVAKAQRERSKA